MLIMYINVFMLKRIIIIRNKNYLTTVFMQMMTGNHARVSDRESLSAMSRVGVCIEQCKPTVWTGVRVHVTSGWLHDSIWRLHELGDDDQVHDGRYVAAWVPHRSWLDAVFRYHVGWGARADHTHRRSLWSSESGMWLTLGFHVFGCVVFFWFFPCCITDKRITGWCHLPWLFSR